MNNPKYVEIPKRIEAEVWGCPDHKRTKFVNAKGDKCHICGKDYVFIEKVVIE